jgi:acetyl-CoA C-acetyltransferase
VDPRTPVIIGIAQLNNRSNDSVEPISMMTNASESALNDCAAAGGAGVVRDRVQAVRVVKGIWSYKDPGRLVADALGLPDASTANTPIGGNFAFDLTTDTAKRIQSGDLDVAIVCAAEAMRTRRRDRAQGLDSAKVAERDGAAPTDFYGVDRKLVSDREMEVKVGATAVNFYGLVETAIRHRGQETVEDHRARISAFWGRASEIASNNPHAWNQEAASAAEISETGPSNRPVAHPYPKLMTSNINVDQTVSFVMASAAAAEEMGVPRSQWVFPMAGVGASDHEFATNRWEIDASPAMRIAGGRALDLAGVSIADCAHIDLYSCFPSAVQVAKRELGLAEERDFTITGGMTFAGGPLNCYSFLSLVRAVELLREQPETRAFITGNGGYLSKHSFLVLSGQPPTEGFKSDVVQDQVDALPARRDASGATTGVVEAYTVTYDREGEFDTAILSCLTNDGGRFWANDTNPDLCADLVSNDRVGATMTGTDNDVTLD